MRLRRLPRARTRRVPILVVDDSAAQGELVSVVLERAGYQVRRVGSALVALAAVPHFRPHLILVDLQLRSRDGEALVRRIKGDPTLSDIRVLGLTNYPMLRDHPDAPTAGCDGVLRRPVDIHTLPAVVARTLAGPAEHRRADA